MIVVGIHNSGLLSSAAVIVDGRLLYGCTEERLDRRKHSKYFPQRAMQACLEWVGVEVTDVDCFAIGWNPAINIGSRYRAGFSEWPGYPGARFYSNPNQILPLMGPRDFLETEQVFHAADNKTCRISYVTHHLAHCMGAYCLSGFEEAAVLSCDGYGERATTVWAYVREGKIRFLRQIESPHSLGSLYSAVTEFLGFRPDLDEWKVMGASAYGNPTTFHSAMSSLIRYDQDGDFELDLSYFRHFDFDTSGMFSPKISELLGSPRDPETPMRERDFDIAASIQKITEDYLFTALSWLKKETGSLNLCLTGGVMMNSVFNGKALQQSAFENVYVPFAPDDSGNSIGAALWVAHQNGQLSAGVKVSNSPYLGRSYSDEQIREALKKYGLSHSWSEDIEQRVAQLLSEGKIVGWFQGRMEFGQRALGARSILADPRDASAKDRMNEAVKYRESFRPFAPSILEEFITKYFEVDTVVAVPYMEKVLPIREEMRKVIPAVVHADGSGRVQTVSRVQNQQYYDLIQAFYQITGVPIVLNTSFNLNGEPIVESPTDAIRTFFSSGMDALAMGHCLLLKG